MWWLWLILAICKVPSPPWASAKQTSALKIAILTTLVVVFSVRISQLGKARRTSERLYELHCLFTHLNMKHKAMNHTTLQEHYKGWAKVTEEYKLFQEGSWKLSEMFYARRSLVKRYDTFYKRYRKMSKIVQRAEYKSKSALKLNLVSPSAFLHSLKLCGDKKIQWDLCQPPATVCLSKQANTPPPCAFYICHCFLAIWQFWAARTCLALIIRLACRIIDSRVGTYKEIGNRFNFFSSSKVVWLKMTLNPHQLHQYHHHPHH